MRHLIRPILLAALISVFVACNTPVQPDPDLNADDLSIITDVELGAGEDFDVSDEVINESTAETVGLAPTTAQRNNFSLKLSFSRGKALDNNVPYRAHAVLNWTGSSPLKGNLKLIVRRIQNKIAVNTTNKSVTLRRNKEQKVSSGVVKVSPDTLLCVDAVFTQANKVSAKTVGRTITYCLKPSNEDKTAPKVTLSAANAKLDRLSAQAVSTVQVTAPGSVVFTVNATDNVGVTKIVLLEDNVVFGESTFNPATFTQNYFPENADTHGYLAKAYDAAGNVGSSTLVKVEVLAPVVRDITAPVLTFTAVLEPGGSPTSDTLTLNKPGRVTFTATASDNVAVTKIVLTSKKSINEGSSVTEKQVTGPGPLVFSKDFTAADLGEPIFFATAFDAAGNNTTSQIIVRVVDSSPPILNVVVNEIDLDPFITPGQVDVTVNASDNFGMISRIQLFEGPALLAETIGLDTLTFSFRPDSVGMRTFTIKAFDTAGNVAEETRTVTAKP